MKRWSVVASIIVAAASSSFASFHLWDDREFFSTADGRVQFIEFFDPSNFEEQTGGQTLRSISSDGSQTNDFVFPTDLPSTSTGGKSMLVGTPGLSTFPGGITPDFTIPPGFLFPGGTVSILFGTANETYGPGSLPLNGRNSMNTPGQTTNAALAQNFAGTTAGIIVPAGGSQRVYYEGLYHNNTNLNPQTEPIPHAAFATNTFLEVHGESDHVDFYYLTASPAGDGSVSTRVRIYALGPHGNAEYFASGTFVTNISLTATNPFHATPASGTNVLDLWHARWTPPAGFTGTGFYAPTVIISNGAAQTDIRYMVAKPGVGTNFGDNAYYWQVEPQLIGTDFFSTDYSFQWTNPVKPNLDYFYYNNPSSGAPENENVPGLGGTKFFEYSYNPLTSSYVYVLAPQGQTTFLQTRFFFVNGGGEVYWQGFFYTNTVVTNTAPFHGQPTSGAVTLEVWRTEFHPPSGWTNNTVYYAPQVHTAQGQFFLVTGLDGSDTNEIPVTNNLVPPQYLYTGGPFGRDWGFSPTGAVLPQVNRDYLYHNNTALNPQTELVPNNTKAFLIPNYATTTTTFYVITDRPANAVPGQNLIVQMRIDYNNPEFGFNAQYYNMVFDQNSIHHLRARVSRTAGLRCPHGGSVALRLGAAAQHQRALRAVHERPHGVLCAVPQDDGERAERTVPNGLHLLAGEQQSACEQLPDQSAALRRRQLRERLRVHPPVCAV